jgi:flagellar hook-basal body complex protein FliE
MIEPVEIRQVLPGGYPTLGVSTLQTEQETYPSFSDLLSDALQEIGNYGAEADRLATELALGRPVELHQVMLAASKAQLAMQLFLEVRNKVIEAYQEISRMAV